MRVMCIYFQQSECNLPNFADACLRFTPQISLREPNVIFLEIERSKRLFSEESLKSRVQRMLVRFELKAKIEIAASVPHSYTLCKYGISPVENLPIEALVDFADPFGTSDDKALPAMLESLKQLGLETVGEFLKLPTSQISSRFGQVALLCRYRILDEMNSPWPQWVPAEKIIEVKEFQYEDFCADIESLLQQLDSVLEKLFLRLWARGLSLAALKISMDFEKFSTSKYSKRDFIFDFLLPQKTKRSITPLIWERLSKEFAKKPIESPIQKITLEVLQSSKDYIGQSNFFSSQEEVREQFNSAMAQLAEEVGRENVFRARILETAVPEQSWQRTLEEQKVLPDVAKHLPQRPTRLLKRPEKVFITHDTIHIRRRPYKILSWSNVEQISTGWIETHIARNYYRLEIENKPTVWIFKSPNDDFYLHGYFD
jgi:protein ImuB